MQDFISKAEQRRFEKASGISEDLIAQAVETIITTRDFCGNEFEAVKCLAIENGLTRSQTSKLHSIANFRANAEWNKWQKAAGVPDKYTF